MYARIWTVGVGVVLTAVCATGPATAAVTSISGSAFASVTEFRSGQAGATNEAAQNFPTPDATLPLQVVARLADPNQAAAVAAAQFADPRTASGPDPDEFAIDVALSSIAADIRHTAGAKTEEIRGVRFSAAEVGAATGRTVELNGRMFVDGALAVFAGTSADDLTGASVSLHVTITKEAEGQSPQEVFTGTLQATGGPNRQVSIATDGRFPRTAVITTDLAAIDPKLSLFRVYVFSNIVLDYPFEATVDQEFSLRATVSVEAANIPGEVGVAAVVGTPIQSLTEVLSGTQGTLIAGKMTTALQQERATPTGDAAFPTAQPRFFLLPACGFFGPESLLGAVGFLGVGLLRYRVRRPSSLNREPRTLNP